MENSYDLQRFLKAQENQFEAILQELIKGKKTSHWMWFVFPQLAGLGRSTMAEFYAIKSRSEADAYIRHPELGARLIRCTSAVIEHRHLTVSQIFPSPDDLKFHSCMTLFNLVARHQLVFSEALKVFFNDVPDEATYSIWNKLLR